VPAEAPYDGDVTDTTGAAAVNAVTGASSGSTGRAPQSYQRLKEQLERQA
jgi:hypothetical protein